MERSALSYHTDHRPKDLESVLGQTHITTPLRSIVEGRKANTFLFSGPSGCGKTTIARIVANMVGCEQPDEIDAARHTGVDAMREVETRTHFVPLHGGATVTIVDECHRLSRQAWESLLKATEEPPKNVYWIFCTTEPDRVPKTIHTRSVSYTVRPVSPHMIQTLLMNVEPFVDEELAWLCATYSRGSPRQALVNLATISGIRNIEMARAALSQAASSLKAVDLARLLVKSPFEMGDALTIIHDIHEENPESVRNTVYHYILAATLSDMAQRRQWLLTVLSEFERPAIEGNKIGDILLRVARLHWRQKS